MSSFYTRLPISLHWFLFGMFFFSFSFFHKKYAPLVLKLTITNWSFFCDIFDYLLGLTLLSLSKTSSCTNRILSFFIYIFKRTKCRKDPNVIHLQEGIWYNPKVRCTSLDYPNFNSYSFWDIISIYVLESELIHEELNILEKFKNIHVFNCL